MRSVGGGDEPCRSQFRLDLQTVDWGVLVTLVELKDIQLPDTMKRAMTRQAEAERERAKSIAAEDESLVAQASVMPRTS